MKILLQDSNTSKFMRCDSMWTTDMDEALDFLSVQRAVFFGMKELGDLFQVLQIEAGEFSSSITTVISQPPWPKIQVLTPEPIIGRKQVTDNSNIEIRAALSLSIKKSFGRKYNRLVCLKIDPRSK